MTKDERLLKLPRGDKWLFRRLRSMRRMAYKALIKRYMDLAEKSLMETLTKDDLFYLMEAPKVIEFLYRWKPLDVRVTHRWDRIDWESFMRTFKLLAKEELA